MPTPRNMDHRIRLGTLTSGSITSTYSIVNRTVASDQKQNGVTIVPWLAPVASVEAIPDYARYAEAMDGTLRGDGFLSFILEFSMWTFGMRASWNTEYFSGGAAFALVSVMVYTDEDVATYLNCTMDKPIPRQDMKPIAGGFEDVRVKFHHGAVTA